MRTKRLGELIFIVAIGLNLNSAIETLAAEPRPNIVLINVDDMGINDLGCFGRMDHKTPNLDRLTSEGLRFTNAYCAQPICSPSRAALMTGRHPARLHLTTYLPGRPNAVTQKLLHPEINQSLPLAEVTIAEVLGNAGYDTACVGKWHLGSGKEFAPDKQGFKFVHAGKPNSEPSATEGSKGEMDLTRAACEFLGQKRNGPFFLYLAHYCPHIPYAARPGKLATSKATWNPVYADVIASLDESIGVLLAKLDELKLADNTILIFISDNGGLHVPEGDLSKTPATHNTPFRAGKGYLHEGGLRVPLIVRWPGKIKTGVNDSALVNTDLLPTLLELSQVASPKNLDGESQAANWLGKSRENDRTFYWHFPHYTNQGSRPGGALRRGDWKYIESYDGGQPELYDLAKDPSESMNLATEQKTLVEKFHAELNTWVEQIGAQENRPNPNFDQAAFDQIYRDFDMSKVPLRATATETAAELKVWRERMNAAIGIPKKAAKAKSQ